MNRVKRMNDPRSIVSVGLPCFLVSFVPAPPNFTYGDATWTCLDTSLQWESKPGFRLGVTTTIALKIMRMMFW